MEKVKLPRRVAEAIDFLQREGWTKDGVVWGVTHERHIKSGDEKLRVLFDFAIGGDNIFKLADALRYGYEIEPEPITVTITPEVQEKVKKYFADKEAERKEAEKDGLTLTVRQIDNEVYGAWYILKVLGIKIPGVNACGPRIAR